jgi:ribosomal protein S18 acetylase RimI-like enzyme
LFVIPKRSGGICFSNYCCTYRRPRSGITSVPYEGRALNEPVAHDALLDNPIWSSLVTRHAAFATGADAGLGLARRYASEIGPLAGLREQTSEAYAQLAAIVPAGDVAVLFLEDEPVIPAGWELVRGGTLVQMVCRGIPEEPTVDEAIVALHREDFPEMLALATLAEPGPFREQTARLGGFVGIRIDGQLAAMAGRRLSPEGFAEVSAVCTHPDFRERGYAKALVSAVARGIRDQGMVPFLTSFETNWGAIRVYEQVGFLLRRRLQLAVLKPPPNG